MVIILPNKSVILANQIVAILPVEANMDGKFSLYVIILNGSKIELCVTNNLKDTELLRDALILDLQDYVALRA